MKLRNKKNGEVYDVINESIKLSVGDRSAQHTGYYTSLAELNEEWEDAPEEPKGYWYMSNRGDIRFIDDENTEWDNDRKQIGNYFETKEEAELAVRKLKAWERLKEKGFKITEWSHGLYLDTVIAGRFRYEFPVGNKSDIEKDLDLLFGGEE